MTRVPLVAAVLIPVLVLAADFRAAADEHRIAAAAVANAFPDAPRHVASNGRTVLMPEIDGLHCRVMSVILDAIDESGYRRGAPVAVNNADRPIFDYENALTTAIFELCPAGREIADPSTAFRGGFRGN